MNFLRWTLKLKITEEGERRKSKNNEESSVDAFMVRDCTKNQNSQNKNVSNANKKNNNNNLKNVKCYSCKRRGHYAANWGEEKRENMQQNYNNNNNNKNSLFSTLNNSDLHSNIRYIESGASSHLCCNWNLSVGTCWYTVGYPVLNMHEEQIFSLCSLQSGLLTEFLTYVVCVNVNFMHMSTPNDKTFFVFEKHFMAIFIYFQSF